ncbi:MAG: hypothetical protein COZ69_13420 [Deltaproteobacteria bacterium CG_4_8_14_3_um_filter_45_9]|nr:MAG: hypothetical protein COS40_16080 [Deltaproteobacteria bacterium CG03_land_8_20_14_0_80_45_14]PIX21693.1 MAG: hypothetical protein COZ69_13420 [Deltaproteobacteria bacterium CG_4_8_14_3_um_filter_45_9]
MPRRREGEAAGPAVQIGSPRPYPLIFLPKKINNQFHLKAELLRLIPPLFLSIFCNQSGQNVKE